MLTQHITIEFISHVFYKKKKKNANRVHQYKIEKIKSLMQNREEKIIQNREK